MSVHLTEVLIDPLKARAWGSTVGLAAADDGYLAHSLLCAAYGDHAPKPFSIQKSADKIRVLGYTRQGHDDLKSERALGAEPSVDACFVSEMSKAMPNEIPVGRKMSFEIRAAVTRRHHKTERDAALFEPETPRFEVYEKWLRTRLEGAAEIVECRIESFELKNCVRRKDNGKGARVPGRVLVPDVLFKGTLIVKDADLFSQKVASGIGRQKAFGYGALLLRAAGN